MSLSSRQELGPYTLVDQIAVGGMAEIYLAKTRGLAGFEKYCALKVIHPDFATDDGFVQMLIDEAKISVGLNHANIAQIFELGRFQDTYYISMEYIDGADLFRIMRNLSNKGVLVPVDVAAYIVQEVATGLDYAHRRCDPDGTPRQIIHRDISPQNILLSQAGEVKIVDFGIAKAASRTRKTQTGVIKGKYFYMSPEQAWGHPVDPRTDIFSAGIVLYEVLTGQMLYLEEDMQKLLLLARQADIPPLKTRRADVPPQLEQIVMKALARRPEDRWQSAAALQSALTSFLFSYAPDFTPERVARLVRVAMDGEAPGSFPRKEVQAPRPAEAWRDSDAAAAPSSHLAEFDDLTPIDGSNQDDPDRTMVSGPPQMDPGNRADKARAGRSDRFWDEDSWADETADLSRTARMPRPVPAKPAARPSAPAPEVIVRARAESDQREQRGQEAVRAAEDPDSVVAPLEPTVVGYSAQAPAPDAPREGKGPRRTRTGASKTPAWPLPGQRPGPSSTTPKEPADPHAAGPRDWPRAERSSPDIPALASTPAVGSPAVNQPAGDAEGNGPGLAGTPPRRFDTAAELAETLRRRPIPLPGGLPPQGFRSASKSLYGAGDPAAEEPLSPALPSTALPRGRRPVWTIVFIAFAITTVVAGAGAGIGLYLLPRIDDPATLEVISVPEGASVAINGKLLKGRTRMVIAIPNPSRPQRVTVSMPDYEDLTTVVQFDGLRRKQVIASLVPKFGQLQLETDPPGADVTIDGRIVGRTPVELTRLSLRAGLRLVFSKTGYRPAVRRVQWDQQTWQRVKVVLQKTGTPNPP